jgi:hypothetical protein
VSAAASRPSGPLQGDKRIERATGRLIQRLPGRMRRSCRKETERDPRAEAQDWVRVREKVEEEVRGVGQAPEETASARDAGKRSPMKQEIPVSTRNVPNAERP